MQAAVGLGPDVDVSAASKGVDDFSKIPTLAVVTIFNLAHLRMVKAGLEEFGLMSWPGLLSLSRECMLSPWSINEQNSR